MGTMLKLSPLMSSKIVSESSISRLQERYNGQRALTDEHVGPLPSRIGRPLDTALAANFEDGGVGRLDSAGAVRSAW